MAAYRPRLGGLRPAPRARYARRGLGDCLTLPGYAPGSPNGCRDNRTGSMVACSSPACLLPPLAAGPSTAATWQSQGVACMPKQYSPESPAPFPPKDPCTIQNAYPCLPSGWPARNSGYYDGDPGVDSCDAFSGPLSFGVPVAAYVAAAPLMSGGQASPPPPPGSPPPPMTVNYQPVLPPPAPPPATQSNGTQQAAAGAGAGQSNGTNPAAVVPFAIPSFVTDDSLIAGVPNWLLGAGALAVFAFLPRGR